MWLKLQRSQFYDTTIIYMDSSHKGTGFFQHSMEDFIGKDKRVGISPYFWCMDNSGISSLSHDMKTFNHRDMSDIDPTLVGTQDASIGYDNSDDASHYKTGLNIVALLIENSPKVE